MVFEKLSVDQQCKAKLVSKLWKHTIQESHPFAYFYTTCLSALYTKVDSPDESLESNSFLPLDPLESPSIRFGALVGLGKCGGARAGSKINDTLHKVFPQKEKLKDHPRVDQIFELYKGTGRCFRGQDNEQAFQELVRGKELYWGKK